MHYDLMLETGLSLMTFRLEVPPEKIPLGPVSIERIADHDLKFLTYTGPVNRGQGFFKIVESGTFELLSSTPARLQVRFTGQSLHGDYVIDLLDQANWRLMPFAS
jgi:hypothetical protein